MFKKDAVFAITLNPGRNGGEEDVGQCETGLREGRMSGEEVGVKAGGSEVDHGTV